MKEIVNDLCIRPPPFLQEIVNYHEIGRSISTLMANTTFHEVAYQAEERESLLQVHIFVGDYNSSPGGCRLCVCLCVCVPTFFHVSRLDNF